LAVALGVLMIAYGIVFHGIRAEMILLIALIYVTAYLLVGVFVAAIHRLETARATAETAHEESQRLLVKLPSVGKGSRDWPAGHGGARVLPDKWRAAIRG
jgi:hypothetical protein